jgi:hypothetical protein
LPHSKIEPVLEFTAEQLREMDLCQKDNELPPDGDVDVRDVLADHFLAVTPDQTLVYRDSVLLRLFTGIPAAELFEMEI